MKIFILLGIVIAAESCISVNKVPKGYYWRDLIGDVPEDALPAGIDSDGYEALVGQTTDNNFVIPGHYRQKSKLLLYQLFKKAHAASNNIKILCTANPNQFEWVKTNMSEVTNIKSHLVIGGYHPLRITHIGRIFIDGKVLVGKVIIRLDTNERYLYLAQNGKSVKYTDYEVLVYNEEKPTSCDKVVNINIY